MNAFRIVRNTKNAYLVRPMLVNSKLEKSLNEGYQRFFDPKINQYCDFELYCTAQSLESLLKYIYNDLGTYIFGNRRHYKTIAGAKKYITNKYK